MLYAGSESPRMFSVDILMLAGQWKFVTTLGAFRHATLNQRRTAPAREGPAVGYVKGEVAFWAVQHVFSLSHWDCLPCLESERLAF